MANHHWHWGCNLLDHKFKIYYPLRSIPVEGIVATFEMWEHIVTTLLFCEPYFRSFRVDILEETKCFWGQKKPHTNFLLWKSLKLRTKAMH